MTDTRATASWSERSRPATPRALIAAFVLAMSMTLGLGVGRAQPAQPAPAQPAPTAPPPAPSAGAPGSAPTQPPPAPATAVPVEPASAPAGVPEGAPPEAATPAQTPAPAETAPAAAQAPLPEAAPALATSPEADAPAAKDPTPPLPEAPPPLAVDTSLEPTSAGPDPDVRLGLGLAFGVLSLPTLGVGLTGLVQLEKILPWPLEISATYGFASEQELTATELDLGPHPFVLYPHPPGGSRLVAHDMRAQVALCPLDHPLSSGTVRVCAGMHGGMLRVDAEGLPAIDSQQRAIVGADLYARFRFALTGPLSLTYSAGLFVPFIRDRFGFIDPYGRFQEHFRSSVICARIDLLLAVAL